MRKFMRMSVVFAIGTLMKSDKTSKLTVAFENVQPAITNVRNTCERLVAEQLTIKATAKKNCNKLHQLSVQPGSLGFPVY